MSNTLATPSKAPPKVYTALPYCRPDGTRMGGWLVMESQCDVAGCVCHRNVSGPWSSQADALAEADRRNVGARS